MIFNCEDKFINQIALMNDIDTDTFLSAYVVMGKNFEVLLHILEGRIVKFPSSRKLTNMCKNILEYIEDDKNKYGDYEKNQFIEIDGEYYKVIKERTKILNHYYVMVMKEVEDEES